MQQTTQSGSAGPGARRRQVSLLSQAGLLAAVAALVGASCCALPLALAWRGIAGAWIANLEVFVVLRPYITATARVLISVGWVIAVRRRASRRTLLILALATVLVGAALLVAHYEAQLTRYLLSLRRK